MSRLYVPTTMSATPPPSSTPPTHPTPPLSAPHPKKKRGGRQLRQVNLSPELKFSIRQFAAEVGVPRLMEPTGFRDFRGWLERVAGPSATHAWNNLVQAMLDESVSDPYRVMFMKEEVVREIVRTIVVPRPGESAKLVSTNCGRQCARPRSGNTLMTILERVLVEKSIVTPNDLEAYMRDRTSPNAYPYRDFQSPSMRPSPAPPPQHHPHSHSHSHPQSHPHQQHQHPIQQHHQVSHAPPHHLGAIPYPTQHTYTSAGRPSSMSLDVITSAPEPRLAQPPLPYTSYPSGHPLRGTESSSASAERLAGHFSPASSASSVLMPLQQQGAARREDRLPSFQELEDSLEGPKRWIFSFELFEWWIYVCLWCLPVCMHSPPWGAMHYEHNLLISDYGGWMIANKLRKGRSINWISNSVYQRLWGSTFDVVEGCHKRTLILPSLRHPICCSLGTLPGWDCVEIL